MSLRSKYFNFPYSATCAEWKNLEETAKKEKPYMWFLLDTIPNAIRPIKWAFDRSMWWVIYRIDPRKWSLWLVKPKTLEVGYNDARELLLHCNMQILCDFYEFQISKDGHVDWNYDEIHRAKLQEMKDIYDWWKLVYPKYDKIWETPIHIKRSHAVNFDCENYPDYCEWIKESSQKEEAQEVEIDEMLIRLVKIRRALWD